MNLHNHNKTQKVYHLQGLCKFIGVIFGYKKKLNISEILLCALHDIALQCLLLKSIIQTAFDSVVFVLRHSFSTLPLQDDKDLVHEFVVAEGLICLIKVGAEADQNYQNYILRGTPHWNLIN